MKITGYESNEILVREIGERMRRLRVNMSLTQKELAIKSGLAEKSIANIESGENVRFDSIISVMRVLGIISNLDVLVPDAILRPENIDFKSETVRKRVRRSGVKSDEPMAWRWGDDKKD